MLHVHGGEHVDTGVQQLFYILPAFRVTRTLGVAVRQFVHQHQRRMARQRGIEIKLLHQPAAILDTLFRQHVQPGQQRGGFAAPVGFDYANQHVQPWPRRRCASCSMA